jgi:hypothetical protein
MQSLQPSRQGKQNDVIRYDAVLGREAFRRHCQTTCILLSVSAFKQHARVEERAIGEGAGKNY